MRVGACMCVCVCILACLMSCVFVFVVFFLLVFFRDCPKNGSAELKEGVTDASVRALVKAGVGSNLTVLSLARECFFVSLRLQLAQACLLPPWLPLGVASPGPFQHPIFPRFLGLARKSVARPTQNSCPQDASPVVVMNAFSCFFPWADCLSLKNSHHF